MSLVSAIHLYVANLDRSSDFYTRLLGYGPRAFYDEGGNAQSTFFVLGESSYLILTYDPERSGGPTGGMRLELAVDDLESTLAKFRERGIDEGKRRRTRFGTDVYDLADPDGHLIRLGPPWTLRAIEGAV